MNSTGQRFSLTRGFAFVLALLVAFTILPISGGVAKPLEGSAATPDVTLTLSGTTGVVINNTSHQGKTVLVKGSFSGGGVGIDVQDGFNGTVILDNITSNSTANAAMLVRGKPKFSTGIMPLTREDLSNIVTIKLVGSNQLKSATQFAGLETQYGTEIIIEDGTGNTETPGYLNAVGGTSSAGIGGGQGANGYQHAGYGNPNVVAGASGGNITIRSGKVRAEAATPVGSGDGHGAGIGGGWVGTYESIILIYDQAQVESIGATHGAGIGGGCYNAGNPGINSAAIALIAPDAAKKPNVTITPMGDRPKLGQVKYNLFIGDITTHAVKIDTDDEGVNASGADIFMNLEVVDHMANYIGRTTVSVHKDPENHIGAPTVPTDGSVNLAAFKVGNTKKIAGQDGKTGNHALIHLMDTKNGSVPYEVNFFSSASTASDENFIPQAHKILENKNITLEAPRYELEAQPTGANPAPLPYGYTQADLDTRVQIVTVKNVGNAKVLVEKIEMEDAYKETFKITDTPNLTANNTIGTATVKGHLVDIGETFNVEFSPQMGLEVGTHNAKAVVSGRGVNIYDELLPMADTPFDAKEQKVDASTLTVKPIPPEFVDQGDDKEDNPDGQLGLGEIGVGANPEEGKINLENNLVNLEFFFGIEPPANPKMEYVISNSPTTPSNGWKTFSGDKNTKHIEDIIFDAGVHSADNGGSELYIHWRVENDNLNSEIGKYGKYYVDLKRPEVSSITGPSSVNADEFYVEIKFDEKVTGLDEAGLDFSGVDIKDIVLVDKDSEGFGTHYKIKVKPNISGGTGNIVVKVKEDAVTDMLGNPLDSGAGGGNGLDIEYNNEDPFINFDFDKDVPLKEIPDEVVIIIDSNSTDENMYLPDGTPIIDASDLPPGFITVKDENGNNVNVEVTLEKDGDKWKVTVKPGPGANFDDGEFVVTVDDEAIENKEGNKLPGKSESFVVNEATRPDEITDSNFKVNPDNYGYQGGTVTVTLTGNYLNQGTYVVKATDNRNPGSPITLSPGKLSDNNTKLTFTLDIGPNKDDFDHTFTFVPSVDGVEVTGLTQNQTVLGSADTNTTGPGTGENAGKFYGVELRPDTLGQKGGNTELVIGGENLHNYGTITVVRTHRETGATESFTFPKAEGGYSEIKISDVIPPTLEQDDQHYDYKVTVEKDALAKDTYPLTQTGAKPKVDDFVIDKGGNTGSGSKNDPIIIDKEGKGDTLTGTVTGENLHNYEPIKGKVTNDRDNSEFWIDFPASKGEHTDTISNIEFPENLEREDITYEIVIYGKNPSEELQPKQVVYVTVKGTAPQVYDLTADKELLGLEAGEKETVSFTIDGKFLDNSRPPLQLVNESTGEKHDVTVQPNRTKGDVDVEFTRTDKWRNDEHDMVVYVDGKATEHTVTIVVGNSNPRVRKVVADKNYFATPEDTHGGKGLVTLTLHGDYMGNFNTLEINDELFEKLITVKTTKDTDMTATVQVQIPSVKGLFTFEAIANGNPTGKFAQVGVGGKAPKPPVLGESGEDIDDANEDGDDGWEWDEEDESFPGRPGETTDHDDGVVSADGPKLDRFVGSGGGNKGRGGNMANQGRFGFDIVEYQSTQASKLDPKNPVIVLRNIDFITREQIDLAAAGAKKGMRESEKAGYGSLVMVFDSTQVGDLTKLEGRLYIDTFGPIPDLYTGVFTAKEETQDTKDLFENRFDNEVHVVSLGQNGTYVVEAEVAAWVDDLYDASLEDGFDEKNLTITRLDRETGDFKVMKNPKASLDAAGYLHFFTKNGGDMIVTDGPLTENGNVVTEGTFGEN